MNLLRQDAAAKEKDSDEELKSELGHSITRKIWNWIGLKWTVSGENNRELLKVSQVSQSLLDDWRIEGEFERFSRHLAISC